jgi:hypothetical protein
MSSYLARTKIYLAGLRNEVPFLVLAHWTDLRNDRADADNIVDALARGSDSNSSELFLNKRQYRAFVFDAYSKPCL